jgi:hypothetical protein
MRSNVTRSSKRWLAETVSTRTLLNLTGQPFRLSRLA